MDPIHPSIRSLFIVSLLNVSIFFLLTLLAAGLHMLAPLLVRRRIGCYSQQRRSYALRRRPLRCAAPAGRRPTARRRARRPPARPALCCTGRPPARRRTPRSPATRPVDVLSRDGHPRGAAPRARARQLVAAADPAARPRPRRRAARGGAHGRRRSTRGHAAAAP